MLAPRAVAIVGASDDPAKTAGRPLRYLKQRGFQGEVWPVNAKRSEVQGVRAFPDLKSLPAVPDQAFILLDTEPAMAALEDAAELGVPVVSMLANGFGEAGAAGARREARLVEIVRGSRTRLLGPNSLGIVRPANGLVCTANAVFASGEIPTGSLSVISQSGSAIGAFVSRGRARGLGFASLISVGNETDLSVGAVGQALVEDEQAETFILFLESIRHAAELEAFAARADAAGKSVLVYKLGRSDVGAELAVSHTGAIVSSDAAADALFRDLGFVRVEMFEALLEATPLFRKRHNPPSRAKPRVAVIATTGGGGALVADRLGLHDVEVVGPTDAIRRAVADAGVALGQGPLIDVTLAGTRPDVMRAAIGAALDEPTFDAVVAVIGSSAEHFPELAVQPIREAVAARPLCSKAVGVFTVPEAASALGLLAKAGIAGFRTPEACVDSLIARLRPRRPCFSRQRGFATVSAELAAEVARLPARTNEDEALALLDRAGIRTVGRRLVRCGEETELGRSIAGLTFPVVAKVSSPHLAHKTDAGGVTLNLASLHDIGAALDRMRAAVARKAPNAYIDGFSIQEQKVGVQEVLIGLRRDPAVGPLVSIGPGGIFAELYGDAAVRRAPVDAEEALAMIAEVRGLEPIRGYRGRAGGDLAALAKALAALSQLGAHARILEAEINPLIVGCAGEGVWAADALLVLAPEMPKVPRG